MSYKNIPMVMKERSQCRSLGHVMLRENEVQEEEETLGDVPEWTLSSHYHQRTCYP
jgi:hypothetical protein